MPKQKSHKPKIIIWAAAAGVVFILTACAQMQEFSSFGASLLNSAGIPVTSGDLNAMFGAGDKMMKAARGFSPEQEYYLGRGVAAVVFSRYKPYRNANLTRYLNKVGRSVASVSERPNTFGGYHFVVLDTQEINAMSAPGGFVFISRGFLRIIPDEDALAAVLSHEVGHIVRGHGTAAISQANVTSALTQLGKQAAEAHGNAAVQQLTNTFGDSIKEVTDALMTKGYSRSQEYEADAYAAGLLARAGYNQQSLLQMLDALAKSGSTSRAGGWFSTHPDPLKRRDELKSIRLADANATPGGTAGENIRTGRYKTAVKGAA